MSPTSPLVNKIQQAARSVVREMFQDNDSIAGAVVGREGGRRLLINSSFLSRDLRSTVKTHQSSRRLTAQLIAMGKQVGAGSVDVIDNRNITAHYKILPLEDKNGLVALEQAVAQELGRTGNLLFVLVGTLIGLRPGAQPIQSETAKELRLDPTFKTDFADLGEGVYGTKTILRSRTCWLKSVIHFQRIKNCRTRIDTPSQTLTTNYSMPRRWTLPYRPEGLADLVIPFLDRSLARLNRKRMNMHLRCLHSGRRPTIVTLYMKYCGSPTTSPLTSFR